MTHESNLKIHRLTAYLGLSAVILFFLSFVLFSQINPHFRLIEDYVSMLGAKGQPFAIWWNLFGFVFVGSLCAVFGWLYGKTIKDNVVGTLFALFGLGFIATSIPVDMVNSTTSLSKAHIVAICLALAAWLVGLARLAGSTSVSKFDKRIANLSATFVVLPIFGFALGLWSMPLTHRLVFGVVFAWMVFASIRLLLLSNRRS